MAPDLFSHAERYPNAPGFKEGSTSRDAANSVKETAPQLRLKVLNLMRGSGGLTPDEAADRLGLSILSVRPRFTELSKDQKIVDTGERRSNESGRKAKVWRAV